MSKPLVLRSSDNQTFEVDASVLSLSQTIKNLIDDDCAHQTIPLLEVTGDVFAMVLEYCKKHTQRSEADDLKEDSVKAEPSTDLIRVHGSSEADDVKDDSVEAWDAKFLADREMSVLSKLFMAADFLSIKGLMELLAQTIADLIKDKSVEEVRVIFNIKNDFTKQEEDQLRKEHAWAYET